MKDLMTVIGFTIKDAVKRKSFIISMIIILAIIVIGFNVPNIINMINGDDESFSKTELTIIDQDNVYEGTLEKLTQIDNGYNITISNNMTLEEVKEKINNEEIEEAIDKVKQPHTIYKTIHRQEFHKAQPIYIGAAVSGLVIYDVKPRLVSRDVERGVTLGAAALIDSFVLQEVPAERTG